MSAAEIADLIAELRAGMVSLEDVAQRFRNRSWPDVAASGHDTYMELASAAQLDPPPDVPGSFDEVTAAYDRGEITREQYRVLAHAVADSINAEAAGEAGPGSAVP